MERNTLNVKIEHLFKDMKKMGVCNELHLMR